MVSLWSNNRSYLLLHMQSRPLLYGFISRIGVKYRKQQVERCVSISERIVSNYVLLSSEDVTRLRIGVISSPINEL